MGMSREIMRDTSQQGIGLMSVGVRLVEVLEDNTAGAATRSVVVLVLSAIRPSWTTTVSSEGRTASLLFLNSRGNKQPEQIKLNLVYEPCYTSGSPEQGY